MPRRHLKGKIGSSGVACFSFDGIKNITSARAGYRHARREILRRVQDARMLGVEKDTEKRHRREILGCSRSWR